MSALVELDRNSRASLRRLFEHYPCLRGSVAAIVEGGMGRVFADSCERPSVALAALDVHLLAGNPRHQNARLLLELLHPGDMAIAHTPEWQHLVVTALPHQLAVYRREAFSSAGFDRYYLRRLSQALPSGFLLRQVQLAEVAQFAADLAPVLVHNFRSEEEFIEQGIGLGVLFQGRFVSGASSAAVGGGRVEIEIQTQQHFRRLGLARAAAAALMLTCLDRDLEPCWDAANEASAALARQLGFRSKGAYDVYRLTTLPSHCAIDRKQPT